MTTVVLRPLSSRVHEGGCSFCHNDSESDVYNLTACDRYVMDCFGPETMQHHTLALAV